MNFAQLMNAIAAYATVLFGDAVEKEDRMMLRFKKLDGTRWQVKIMNGIIYNGDDLADALTELYHDLRGRVVERRDVAARIHEKYERSLAEK